jgi:hypothetical protein
VLVCPDREAAKGAMSTKRDSDGLDLEVAEAGGRFRGPKSASAAERQVLGDLERVAA